MKVSVSFLSLPLSAYVLYSKTNVTNGFTFSAQPQLLGAWPLRTGCRKLLYPIHVLNSS